MGSIFTFDLYCTTTVLLRLVFVQKRRCFVFTVDAWLSTITTVVLYPLASVPDLRLYYDKITMIRLRLEGFPIQSINWSKSTEWWKSHTPPLSH